jgi:hypothetical protein
MRTYSLLMALLLGCAAPTKRVVATGEPLAVVDDIKFFTTTEKVAETVHKDSAGTTIGTSDTFAQRTLAMPVWYPAQGNQKLADEDFFRIAGDEQALAEVIGQRESGRAWNRRGWLTIGISGGVLVGGLFLPSDGAKAIVTTSSLLGMTAGGFMIYKGHEMLDPDNHAVDRSVAERAARDYNAELVGVSVNGSF